MNILVTGGAGYLGSVLIPKLLVRGHKVRTLDIGYFGVEHIRAMRPAVEILRDDIRAVLADQTATEALLKGMDVVIHLAAISNDPSAELNPRLTEEVNFEATRDLAVACKARGCRFIFSSSCSVYGEAAGEASEDGQTNPLTAYAKSKVDSDQFLLSLADANWRPAILRNGTLYGFSPRMRFDLVINIFSYCSTLYNEVRVFGDGQQWRPFLHVADCARAFIHFAENPRHKHVICNIAHENFRVVDLVEIFQRINPACKPVYVKLENPDLRNYHVSVARMKEEGITPTVKVQAGAEEIIEAIVTGRIADPEAVYYRNAKWLKELSELGSRDHRSLIGMLDLMASARR
ncbi:MAG: NAD-dependent epimerase/dehydratase [Limisphaerales bacterium]|nr:MAG: NAD-dependent epimerase/dehydratase [Limisphaerales bacterium]KAG0510126.1 MAG: NAD-dependent epimerase/dehydratase [Limisphaerales bacterium]TXT52969.1 MAG: NAD-dependent epimerase/dehydratase [Limisphaerales bacterium]